MHLTTPWRLCWRYNTKEYVISSIVGSSRRGWLTLSDASREIDCKLRILNHPNKKSNGLSLTRALIGGGGGVHIHIFMFSPTDFLWNLLFLRLISKGISRAEHEYMNMHPSPQLTLCSLLAVNSQFSVFIDQKMQLTG